MNDTLGMIGLGNAGSALAGALAGALSGALSGRRALIGYHGTYPCRFLR